VSEQRARLARGGRIDRSRICTFTFDGRTYTGCAGDTVASALLANGVHLVGRSFKLHRPRGIVGAGVDEPNALLTLRGGGRTEPNIQATMAELYDGLSAVSQNRWPSLALDALSINGLFSRFMPAGFYYKTFMGPTRGAWMWFEPAIRRAAGLGKAARERDPDRYEREHAFCDVLVVGAGPAGIAAALAAGRAGSRVLLLEQMATAGGALLDERTDSHAERWRSEHLAELEALDNVTLMTRTTVFGVYDGGVTGALERVHDHEPEPPRGQPRQRLWTVRAARTVFAAGSTERPLLFGDNDCPGVMLASAARRYLNHFGVLPGRRVVVHANNDSAYAAAGELRRAGAEVTVVDRREQPAPDVGAALRADSIELISGARVERAHGRHRVRAVTVADARGTRRLDCDLVCVAGGWSPNVHLASHLGHRPVYDARVGAFVPDTLPEGQFAVGTMTGELDDAGAVAVGWRAGLAAAGQTDDERAPAPPATAAASGWVHAHGNGEAPRGGPGKTFVDLQNDVTDRDVALAFREGYRSVEHLKRYTTLGMGTDQGRTSNINGLELMAGLRGQSIPETGTTTFRPPFTPVALGALVGRRTGRHFRPERRTPMHDCHRERGAEFVRAGQWLRPRYYPEHGADVDTAYVAEMRAVREAVGMVDVSTLGKIDVQGPDAPEFLNRVYANGWLKLAVGKARYGAMLRDDGLVFDDGTTSRLAEHRYFMTTTTAEAGPVMSWLEFLLDTAWPDLRVHVTSVSDQWAGVAVAGSSGGHVLAAALDGVDTSDDTLPPMGVRDATTDDGLPVRILRVSFSGERAYEVYTPAGYGAHLWERLMAAGQPHGIEPYGTEALGGLRIEKGHPAGPELDGRTTLDDLGLGRMARPNKPFVGDVLRHRPALESEDRRRLVGLQPVEPGARLRAGALVFPDGAPVEGHGIGHVTSVTWSPTLGHYVALALVAGGPAREGEIVAAASPVHGEHVRVQVVPGVFLDPEGERIHA